MQFKIGDRVIHPAHGTGQIVNVKEKQFSGKTARLYYEIALPKFITLWVPIETEEASRLRLETAKSELNQHPDLLKIAPPVLLNTNHQQHPLELVNRLKQGSFQRMREVVRDLTAWGWRKRYWPDQYDHLAEDPAEPLLRMGDDG
jgi:CarD family transcriptional regulator